MVRLSTPQAFPFNLLTTTSSGNQIEAHAYGIKLIPSLYDKNVYESGGVYQAAYPNNEFYTNSQARVDYNNVRPLHFSLNPCLSLLLLLLLPRLPLLC